MNETKKKRKKTIIKNFRFENYTIDVIVNNHKDNDLSPYELRQNYIKLLEFRNGITVDDASLRSVLVRLFTTRTYKTYLESIKESQIKPFIDKYSNEILYYIFRDDKRLGIITKKMVKEIL